MKKQVYLFEISDITENQVKLPYSTGLIWGYCALDDKIKSNYELGLSSNKIVVQKLPSIRMHPNYTYRQDTREVIVKTTSQSWGKWSNMHKDSDAPYHHPKFDINFWMPLIDVSLENTMYVETSPNNYEPVLLKYGELLEFKGNTTNHGGKVYNSSEDFRTSLDFRGCTYDNYDESVLEDIPIFVTGKKDTTQKNWFVIDEYYSLYER